MRAPAAAILLLAVAAAQDAEQAEKEDKRIKARVALSAGFSAPARLVADRFEAFALEPIRNWESAESDILASPAEALVDPVHYYLLDDDWEVQAFACAICGKAGLAGLLPELEQAYAGAQYPIIRIKAVEAAARMAREKHEAQAAPLLERALDDKEPGARLAAVAGLEALDRREALGKAGKDADADTKYAALGALARLGDAGAQEALLAGFRSYVANRDLERRASLETLDVGERYAQFLNALAIGHWGGEKGIKLLEEALLRKSEYKNKLFLAIGAAAALGRSRPAEDAAASARDRALGQALGDGDTEVRGMGALAAGYAADPRHLRALQRLLGDAQIDVRHNAVEALGRIADPAAVKMLASVLRSESTVEVRLAAVRALARHEDDEVTDALVRALNDRRYMLRATSARMLGRRGAASAGAVPALVRKTRDQDYGVREAAVVALGRIGALEGLPGIVNGTFDRDEQVRIRALRALARFPHTDAVRQDARAMERCVSLLVGATEAEQREAARDCLARVRSPLAVPLLLQEMDADAFSRRTAAFSVVRAYGGGRTLDYSEHLPPGGRREALRRWKEWWDGGGPIAPLPPPPTKRAGLDLPRFHRYTRDLRWRGLDLVLCYDSTGSMIPLIRAVKQRLDVLIEESSRIVPNLRLSLFTYRDEGEEYVYYGTPLTYAADSLKAFVQVAEANRGGDLPEAVTQTVEAAVERLAWRAEAQKVIVVIGDAPYHPENAARLFSIVQKFARKENRGVVHAIFTDPNRLGEAINARKKREESGVTYPFLDRFQEMAKHGGGKAITIEDSERLIYEILVLSFGEEWRSELEKRLDFD